MSSKPPGASPPPAAHSSPGSDAHQKPKRARTSKPKVKTGCNNCKQRRIKCDEKRPSCTQCVRSKKTCTGYPPPSRSARSNEVVSIAPKPMQPAQIQIAPRAAATVAATAVTLTPRRIQKIQHRGLTPPQTPVMATSTTLYRPSNNLSLPHLEGLYFQLFRTHTASELSGYFDSVFWTRTVLQECHSESAIRHAVVALGALYKTLEQSCESPPSSPSEAPNPIDTAMRHWEVAVKQYSEACNALVHLNSQDQRSSRTLLMANVLLACFDSFVGDHRQAIIQIQNGLGLLERLRAERRRSFLMGYEEPVEEELIAMFTRLAIQAKSYDMAFHFPQPYVIRLTPQGPEDPASPPSDAGSSPASTPAHMPDEFSSLLEARACWDKLCEKLLRFTETMFKYTTASGANNPMGILPKSLKAYGLAFKGRIDMWSEAFDHILDSRTAPGVSHQEKAGIAVLKMFQIMTLILYMMTFSDNESQFDLFQPQFKAIVDLALEVVGDEERRAAAKRCPDPHTCQHRRQHPPDIFGGHEYAAHHIKPSFSADLGIVPPLYVVATKCRNPVVRRQAIQLLKSSARREGMWDSQLTARIGHWIASIEEEEERSPVAEPQHPATNGQARHGSIEFAADVPLGPGGNARWGVKRESAAPGMLKKRTVPEERRVMVRAVDFDLRARFARLQVGTRGLTPGSQDMRARETHISW